MEFLFKTKENVSTKVAAETVKASVAFKGCKAYIAKDRGEGRRASVVFTNAADEIVIVSTSEEVTPLVRSGQVTLENLLALDVIQGANGGYFFCRPSNDLTKAVTVSNTTAKPLSVEAWEAFAAL